MNSNLSLSKEKTLSFFLITRKAVILNLPRGFGPAGPGTCPSGAPQSRPGRFGDCDRRANGQARPWPSRPRAAER